VFPPDHRDLDPFEDLQEVIHSGYVGIITCTHMHAHVVLPIPSNDSLRDVYMHAHVITCNASVAHRMPFPLRT